MNTENLLRLRELIARLPSRRLKMDRLTDLPDNETFGDMVTHCGSAGCIAGWATALFDPTIVVRYSYEVIPAAREHLGLTYEESQALFLGEVGVSDLASYALTKEDILEAIDATLAGREPAWVAAIGLAKVYDDSDLSED